MSTALAPAPVTERSVLRQLTLIQAKRFATHPLYLAGLAGWLLLTLTAIRGEDPYWMGNVSLTFSFFIGVLGLVVAYRLTVSEERALDLLPSSPTSGVTRTLALAGACLVPAITALVLLVPWVVMAAVGQPGDKVPQPASGLIELSGGWGTVLVMLIAHTVVACLGGPMLGVAAGRWLRFPGAGVLVAATLVVAVTFVGTWALQIPGTGESWWARALAAACPWGTWVVLDHEAMIPLGIRPGSPVGHLLYTICLSGLAVWAAVMRDAEGAVRAHWRRIGAGLGVAAVLTFLWALLG